MTVNGLAIPERLLELIDAGLWPRTGSEAMRQNLHCLIPPERIQAFAPEEDRIYLYAPPFGLVANALKNEPPPGFYSKFGAVHELVPDAAVEIGDFGVGSDAPILLDYRFDAAHPRVIRLRWAYGGGGRDNHWVTCADTFEQFAAMLWP